MNGFLLPTLPLKRYILGMWLDALAVTRGSYEWSPGTRLKYPVDKVMIIHRGISLFDQLYKQLKILCDINQLHLNYFKISIKVGKSKTII